MAKLTQKQFKALMIYIDARIADQVGNSDYASKLECLVAQEDLKDCLLEKEEIDFGMDAIKHDI